MKRCVYTVLTAGYETLNEQPAARDSGLPFICFTDDPATTSETWQIRPLTAPFPLDGVRSQRSCKLRPYLCLPEFDESLYIDNSVHLKQPPEALFALADLAAGLALPAHSFRATVMDEFLKVTEDRLDDPARIAEQLAHYEQLYPDLLTEKPFWSAIMLRDHRNPTMIAAMEIWLAHIYRYSRRDQLSGHIAFALAGLAPQVLGLDNHDSEFHRWPNIPTRNASARLWQGAAPPGPETAATQRLMRQLELNRLPAELADLQDRHAAVLASKSWRLTAPLRAVLEWRKKAR